MHGVEQLPPFATDSYAAFKQTSSGWRSTHQLVHPRRRAGCRARQGRAIPI